METEIPETHRQDQVVACRLTRHERLLLESIAARDGTVLAQVVRRALLDRVQEELRRQLVDQN